jgi:hypothetical protein
MASESAALTWKLVDSMCLVSTTLVHCNLYLIDVDEIEKIFNGRNYYTYFDKVRQRAF